ncbi:unnamed protein product [Rhizoctonia solani]|uniref:Uncharacterized protein n=1 Tax=Rhizoctonia solani TaxID=456999 RepID=A0A8H3DS94_9AGAM|nr:unnamed protein product [Rhizoctonia solani]
MASTTRIAATVAPENATDIRRRPIWGVGGLVARGVSGLVNIPGIKDAALFAKKGAKALKAPKWNDEQTRKQIDNLEGVLARVDTTLAACPDLGRSKSFSTGRRELNEVESFRREMEAHKVELEETLAEKYSTKLARQNDIAQSLAQKNEEVSSCIADFCVSLFGSETAEQHRRFNLGRWECTSKSSNSATV